MRQWWGGCLLAFSCAYPDWLLEGFEVTDKYREQVLAIPGVQKFHCGAMPRAAGYYDAITLIHAWTHSFTPDVLAVAFGPVFPGWLSVDRGARLRAAPL